MHFVGLSLWILFRSTLYVVVYDWQESVEREIAAGRESFACEVNSFCENYDLCSEGTHTRQLAASAEIQQLTRDIDRLETGASANGIFELISK